MLFVCVWNSQAQTITSQVVATTGEAIPHTTVFLQDTSGKNVAYTTTTNTGIFTFADEVKLKASAFVIIQKVGKEKQTIALDNTKENYGVPAMIYLASATELLDEITIKAVSPITVKKDTVVYNVQQLAKGDERVIEDLLKNLPGIDVDGDGKITANGKEVEKVMVDGTDFFESGYRVLTKNMPVKPIEEVELLQNYSANKHLKGINADNKVALNLKLNENAKRVWFGNVEAGVGVRDEVVHSVRSNIMNFGKKVKFYTLLQSNDISYDATGDLSAFLSTRYGEIETPPKLNHFVRIEKMVLSLQDHHYKNTNNQFVTVNTAINFSPALEVKVSGLLNKETLLGNKAMEQIVYTPDTFYQNSEDTQYKDKSNFSYLKAEADYAINSFSSLKYNAKGSIIHTNVNSGILYNAVTTNQVLRNTDNRFEQNIEYTAKLSKNKALIVSYKNIYENNAQDYWLAPNVYADESNTPFTQQVKTQQNYHGVQAAYKSAYGDRNFIHVFVGNNSTNTHIGSVNTLAVEDSNAYSNNSVLKVNELYAKVMAQLALRFLNFRGELTSSLFANDLQTLTTHTSNQKLVISPRVRVEALINEANKVSIAYKRGYSNINASKIFNGYIQTSFRNLLKGTTNLEPFTDNFYVLDYTLGNYTDRFFANFSVSYTQYNDFYTQNNYVYPTYTQSSITTGQGNEAYLAFASIDYYWKKVRNYVRFSTTLNQSDFYNSLNDSEVRRIRSISLSYGIELRSNFRSRLNYLITTKWYDTKMKIADTSSFLDTQTRVVAKLNMWDDVYLNMIGEVYSFDKVAPKRKFYSFLDVDMQYKPSKSKWSGSIVLKNILNTKSYDTYSLTDYSSSITSYTLLSRQFLLSATYSF